MLFKSSEYKKRGNEYVRNSLSEKWQQRNSNSRISGALSRSQYLEVPPFQDHYPVEEVFLDGKRITLRDRTISGLFNYLNTK
ncbi:hypothetical protein [Enterococcus casseliflavus]|uniref:hypothetical protein n=1 Tax=Enterococcus casseliflavus TaxID=37734 RepID=UPI0035CAFD31